MQRRKRLACADQLILNQDVDIIKKLVLQRESREVSWFDFVGFDSLACVACMMWHNECTEYAFRIYSYSEYAFRIYSEYILI